MAIHSRDVHLGSVVRFNDKNLTFGKVGFELRSPKLNFKALPLKPLTQGVINSFELFYQIFLFKILT